jgi:hypothetical protein
LVSDPAAGQIDGDNCAVVVLHHVVPEGQLQRVLDAGEVDAHRARADHHHGRDRPGGAVHAVLFQDG